MKKILQLIILTLTIYSYSQDKTIIIELEHKQKITGINTAENGDQFIRISNGKKNGTKLIKYDTELNKQFDISITNPKKTFPLYKDSKTIFYGLTEFTNSGKFYLNNLQLIDINGKIKDFNIFKFWKTHKVNRIFTFYNDYGYTVIGPSKGRVNYKKKYKEGEINIITLTNNDNKTIISTIKTPKIATNQKTPTWYLGSNYIDSFYLLSKDDLDEKRQNQNFHLVKYNYQGKPLSYTLLPLNLGEKHIYLTKYGDSFLSSTNNKDTFGFNKVYINKDEKTYYIYGLYADKLKGKHEGTYLHKYNKEGKLIWKKIFKDYYCDDDFIHFDNEECLLSSSGGFLQINTNDGSVIKSGKRIIDKYKINNKHIYKDNIKHLNTYYEYKKVFGKKYFSDKTILGFHINPKIKNFIINNNKEKLYYDVKILKNKKIILKEFDVKNNILSLYLFN